MKFKAIHTFQVWIAPYGSDLALTGSLLLRISLLSKVNSML